MNYQDSNQHDGNGEGTGWKRRGPVLGYLMEWGFGEGFLWDASRSWVSEEERKRDSKS